MKTSKSAVFLFELMVIILVFTLASAVCAQIFASSYRMSVDSREKSMSAISAQTAAEKFKSGEVGESADALGEGGKPADALYDSSWQATDDEGVARYRVSLENDKTEGHLRSAEVVVYRDGESIYSMKVKVFVS